MFNFVIVTIVRIRFIWEIQKSSACWQWNNTLSSSSIEFLMKNVISVICFVFVMLLYTNEFKLNY